MSDLGTVIAIMASAFITGALARFAVPGPDPMPAWLTISIGLVGSAVGIGVDSATDGKRPVVASTSAFLTAVVLVIAYRKLVQKRPISGPEAMRFPRRGIGIRQYRERLARAGVDPDALIDRVLEERRRADERRGRSAPPGDSEREQDAQDDDDSPGQPPEKDDRSASDS